MPEPSAPLLAAERADLLGLLSGVEGESWAAVTPARGWTVKEVVAHLVESDLALGRLIRREIDELRIDPQIEESRIDNWRPLPGVAVRAALWQHGTAAQRLLDALPDEGWERPVALDRRRGNRRWKGTVRLRDAARLHLIDLCVHGHDIASALGLDPVWTPRLPQLAETTLRLAPVALSLAGAEPAGSLRIAAGGVERIVDGASGRWSHRDAGASDAALECDEPTLALLAAGRVSAQEALSRATSVEGDRATAERILDSMRAP